MGIDVEVMKGTVADVMDGDGSDEHFMDEVKVAVASNDALMHVGNVETGSGNGCEQRSSCNAQHPNMVEWGIETDRLHGWTDEQGHNGPNDVKLEEIVRVIANLELQNQRKEEMVTMLKEDVARLKRKLELQAVNIVEGFESVLQMKNEELDKLKNENMELRKKLTVLEDQLAERDVHDVTQAFWVVEVGRNSGGVTEGGFRCVGVFVCDVSPLGVVGLRSNRVDAGIVDDV
ncbi:hypothetical protein ACSBR2_004961 [Camellia fascicularis]